MPNALITGGSAGLGYALTRVLLDREWRVTIDGRRADLLEQVRRELAAQGGELRTVAGDVTDPAHRAALVDRACRTGPIDLLVNNASELGGSPPPRLADLAVATHRRLWEVNVVAPLQLINTARRVLSPTAVIMNISSDAAVEHYPRWGGYGGTKAALDHLTETLAAEEPGLTCYAVDPGDMRTAMHQAASPSEDITDLPDPSSVAPVLLSLLGSGLPSGRYRAVELVALVGQR